MSGKGKGRGRAKVKYLSRKKARVDSEIESDGSLPRLHEDVVDEVVTAVAKPPVGTPPETEESDTGGKGRKAALAAELTEEQEEELVSWFQDNPLLLSIIAGF